MEHKLLICDFGASSCLGLPLGYNLAPSLSATWRLVGECEILKVSVTGVVEVKPLGRGSWALKSACSLYIYIRLHIIYQYRIVVKV